MKTTLLILSLLSLSGMAMEPVEIQSTRFYGGNHLKLDEKGRPTKPTSCTYSAGKIDPTTPEMVNVFVNSDEASHINGRLDIPAQALPLVNGYVYVNTEAGIEISYKSGVLTYTRRLADEFVPFAKEVRSLRMRVSPDLRTVRWAKVDNFLDRAIRKDVQDAKMVCYF